VARWRAWNPIVATVEGVESGVTTNCFSLRRGSAHLRGQDAALRDWRYGSLLHVRVLPNFNSHLVHLVVVHRGLDQGVRQWRAAVLGAGPPWLCVVRGGEDRPPSIC
jgi:hypothetical protein